MAMAQHPVVIGVFTTQQQAQNAIDELKRAGFGDDEIGFLTRANVAETSGAEVGNSAAVGAVEGGLLGGALGAAAALLIPGIGPALATGIFAAAIGGAALGAAAGGLIGALTELGVSQADARFYQQEIQEGRSIVTVKVTTDQDEAERILRHNNASDVRKHEGLINAVPPQRPYGETRNPDQPV